MKNSADQGGCYLTQPSSSVDTAAFYENTKAEFNNWALLLLFALSKNNTTLTPGFLGQWFNNLQRAALLTSF